MTTTYGTEVDGLAQPADGSIGWVAWTAASAVLLLAGAGLGLAMFRIRPRSESDERMDDELDRLAPGG